MFATMKEQLHQELMLGMEDYVEEVREGGHRARQYRGGRARYLKRRLATFRIFRQSGQSNSRDTPRHLLYLRQLQERADTQYTGGNLLGL